MAVPSLYGRAGLTPGKVAVGVMVVLAVTGLVGYLTWALTGPPDPAPTPAPPAPATGSPDAARSAPAAPSESAARAPMPGSRNARSSRSATAATASAAPRPFGAADANAAAPRSFGAADANAAAPAPARKPPADVKACFGALLPSDAFSVATPELDDLCGPGDAYALTLRLKAEVVKGGMGRVTQAMADWSRMGWYETAAYALMRGWCCPGAARLSVPKKIASCEMDAALAGVAAAADRMEEVSKAAQAFGKAARCVSDGGNPELFGRWTAPHAGERAHFQKVVDRLMKEKKG